MSFVLYCGILLAQGSRLDSMSSRFRRGSGPRIDFQDVVIGAIVLCVVIALIWALSYLLKLQEKGRGFSSPFGLFLVLCRAHRLRWRQRWLLWRLARSQQLRDPGCLFVEPERFESENISPQLQPRADRLQELRDRLFAWPEPKKDEPDSGPADAVEGEPAAAGSLKTPTLPASPAPTLDIPPWPPTSSTPPMVGPS